MVAVKNILLLVASASAFSIFPRQDNQIYSDMQKINAAADKLTTAVNDYANQPQGLLKGMTKPITDPLAVQQRSSELESALVQATQNTRDAAPLNEEQAKQAVAYYDQEMKKSVKKAKDAVRAKQPEFEKAGLSPRVEKTLQRMRDETSAYGEQLVKKAPPQQKDKAFKSIQEIDGDFARVLQVFVINPEKSATE